jgi:hypothetical protein
MHLLFPQVLPVCEQLQLVVVENPKDKILAVAVWPAQVVVTLKKHLQ